MSMLEKKQGQEWIDRVKSGGGVPLLEPDHCPSGWASPHGDAFMVRGAEYLKTKAKTPGGEYLLKPLGFDWIKGPTKVSELLNNPKGRVRTAIDDECSKGRKPFVWAFNFQLPTKDNHSMVAYFVGVEPSHEHLLIRQFLEGDDAFKNSRLKLIANVVKGPWIVKKAVGEQAICVIGRVHTCRYSMGENFVEVDIDVGSSMVASAVVHLAFGYLTTLTIDLAFLIEGQTESELPERILGAIRLSELNAAAATQMELPSEGNLQSSLPARFWKSFEQGFSHLIHPVAQRSDDSNGAIDHDTTTKDAEKT
ncbi:ENHANCED DISEASE RESISTANCE-like protein [Perilla frutescens var. frutescens]|nr:ENHANCED DISEASE RESISTANCE-like protein [Perilla frutescens var. frutescens]